MASPQPRTLHEQASRGERARAILESDIVIESFRLLRISCFETWRATDPKDTAGREWCFTFNAAMDRFEQALTKVMADGMIAAKEIADQRREERSAEVEFGDHAS